LFIVAAGGGVQLPVVVATVVVSGVVIVPEVVVVVTVVLGATAACIFPVMLRSVGGDGQSLTAYNASVPLVGLRIAFSWWILGFPLAILYFVTLFRIHRGRAIAASGREGY